MSEQHEPDPVVRRDAARGKPCFQRLDPLGCSSMLMVSPAAIMAEWSGRACALVMKTVAKFTARLSRRVVPSDRG